MTLPNWTRRFRKVVHALFQRVRSWSRGVVGFVKARRGWLVLLVLVVATGVGVWAVINNWEWLSTTFWEWLRDGPSGVESGSTTVRNLGLVIAGVIALPLAIWRSIVAQLQANTAQQTLLNERYQQGAEMLGNDLLTVRLGGIYTLQRLAEEHPEQYHVQIMRLLCAFVRHPTTDEEARAETDAGEVPPLREDVQAVVAAISACHARQLDLEQGAQFLLDLHGANLAGVLLQDGNLSNARLGDADLSGARLSSADLSEIWLVDSNLSRALLGGANLSSAVLLDANLFDASLSQADLSGALLHGANLALAQFQGANLSGASLSGANFSGADFSNLLITGFDGEDEMFATRVTQAQIDKAHPNPSDPPILEGVLDAETGKPLEWRGKLLDD